MSVVVDIAQPTSLKSTKQRVTMGQRMVLVTEEQLHWFRNFASADGGSDNSSGGSEGGGGF